MEGSELERQGMAHQKLRHCSLLRAQQDNREKSAIRTGRKVWEESDCGTAGQEGTCIQAWMATLVDWGRGVSRCLRAAGHSETSSRARASHHMPVSSAATSFWPRACAVSSTSFCSAVMSEPAVVTDQSVNCTLSSDLRVIRCPTLIGRISTQHHILTMEFGGVHKLALLKEV